MAVTNCLADMATPPLMCAWPMITRRPHSFKRLIGCPLTLAWWVYTTYVNGGLNTEDEPFSSVSPEQWEPKLLRYS